MTYGADGAEFSITEKHEAPTISSQKYIFFGKVSAYIKSSPGTGIVSSFILESDDLDEIDWEWLGSDDAHVQTNFFGKGDVSTYDRSTTVAVSTPIESWHTYTIDWNADRIIWSIDNNPVRTLTYGDPLTHQGTRYPQTPMKIKMGNWIGCLDASDPATTGTCQWAGGQAVFDSTTKYQMLVQTVTIEDYGCGSEYTYGDMSGSWQSIKTSGDCGGKSSPSSGSSSPSSASSSVSTKSSGGVFAQTSTSSSVASSSTSVSTSTKASSSAESTKTSGATTLTTATTASQPSNTAASNTTPAGTTAPAGTSASTPTPSSNDGNSSKSKYGVLDYAVIALGLGLGYLVM
jgi:beta-glucanase (GH16 family)